jgi:hypothetical protein
MAEMLHGRETGSEDALLVCLIVEEEERVDDDPPARHKQPESERGKGKKRGGRKTVLGKREISEEGREVGRRADPGGFNDFLCLG